MEAWGESGNPDDVGFGPRRRAVQTSKGGNDQERSDLDVYANPRTRVNASVRSACPALARGVAQGEPVSAEFLEGESPLPCGDERQGGQPDPRGSGGSGRGETSEGRGPRTHRSETWSGRGARPAKRASEPQVRPYPGEANPVDEASRDAR